LLLLFDFCFAAVLLLVEPGESGMWFVFSGYHSQTIRDASQAA